MICVQTIKKTGNTAPFERDEWEAEIDGREPVLSLANGTGLESLLDDKLGRQLKPLFETRVRRTSYLLDGNSHDIELTIDRGMIRTGARKASLCESNSSCIAALWGSCSRSLANLSMCCRHRLPSKAKRTAGTN